MGFHGVQLFGLAFVGYGISVAANGDYAGRVAAMVGLIIVLLGLVVDPVFDSRILQRYLGKGRTG